MSNYTQRNRPLAVETPLGEDALLLVGFAGQELISQPFSYHLDMVAENHRDIKFEALLGQPITVRIELATGENRYVNGLCAALTQGERDEVFTDYAMRLVPSFWLLTKRMRSRIFQQQTIPEILKQVLEGVDVSFKIEGMFYPRDFCVQYRETDFNFASRVMEEEGIYYFFEHTAHGHRMVLANTPQGHPDLPGPSPIIFEEILGNRRLPEDRIHHWEKTQELTAGRYTLWDHCFELPHRHLEATQKIPAKVPVGQVVHSLELGSNASSEIFDWPGEYAQRYDGVNPGGVEQPDRLRPIFEDNQRTTRIRMEQEAMGALVLHGAGFCRQFVAGHKFTLAALEKSHEKGYQIDGPYVLTSVTHTARQGSYRSNDSTPFTYHNSFTCIPFALPFRPRRTTPKPTTPGTQTAVVVGPPGAEIATDKYGRVKVQFHWDREGKNDLDSSCWLRVAQLGAGQQWGFVRIPRVGEEVIVDFLEGDPDQPIIIGSVYNAQMMPPYALPENQTQSGYKTRSTPNGDPANFNELRFEDKKGAEHIYFHAEKDFQRTVENSDMLVVGNNRSVIVTKGNLLTKVQQGKIDTEALQALELRVGQNSIRMDQSGITMQGLNVQIAGEVQTQVQGLVTHVTGDALLKMNGPPLTNGVAGSVSHPIHNLVQQVVNEAVDKLAAAAVGGHGSPDLLHQVMQNAVGKLAGAILPGGKPGSPADAFHGLMNQVVQEAVSKLTAAVHPGGPGKNPPPHGAPTPVAKSVKETRRSS